MPNAQVKYLNIGPNKFNESQTQISIGFDLGGGELTYMRYVVAGGSEKQQQFASLQLSKLLKLSGPIPVTVQTNERGYPEVYADDGFRSDGAGSEDDGGF